MPIFRRRAKAEGDTWPRDRFEDKPTTQANADLLQFSHFVEPLAGLIEKRQTPLTIGIYGEWGSGKTSFLRLLEDLLKGRGIYPIWFNAWKYNKDENLWSALIQTIINQSGKQGSFFGKLRVKYRLWRFRTDLGAGARETSRVIVSLMVRAFIIFLCVITGLRSLQISNALNTFLTAHALIPVTALPVLLGALVTIIGYIALDPTKLWDLFVGGIHFDYATFERTLSYRQHIAFYDQFSEEFQRLVGLLRPRNKPLVVIIDDMDRCLPEHALSVLENIKVFLDDTDCIFLMGVDKKVVELAIAAKYKEVGIEREIHGNESPQLQQLQLTHPANHRRIFHEDYFDKIIPQAFVVPQLRPLDIGKFIRALNRLSADQLVTRAREIEIAVDTLDPAANIIDPNVATSALEVNVIDRHVELCSDIFSLGLPPNPRKIKRALSSFRFVRDLILARINEQDMERVDILASLLAKLIVIQNQFPQFYEAVIKQPSLLGELETYYRSTEEQAQSFPPERKISADSYAKDYSGLRDILAKKINEQDTFVDADVHLYISLIGTLAEVRSSPVRRAPPDWPPVQATGALVEGTPGIGRIAPVPGPGVADALFQQGNVPAFAPIFWNVPSRNSLFTAREDILRLLRDELVRRHASKNACIALCGLGGIGKTQIATEYAYRYRDRYRLVLWVSAESRDALLTDFAAIAEQLHLADGNSHDQSHVVENVMNWLRQQTDWLLVLDGITNLNDVRDAVLAPSNGHTLLTTRQQITSTSNLILSVDVDSFPSDEGMLLLLRRAGIIGADSLLTDAPQPDRKSAREIVRTLDGLPLALDQAGAYIEETHCTLAEYLERYRKSSTALLGRRGYGRDHPEPVATTWSLSFPEVQKDSPAAAELLQLCAFLAPDDIPVEIFIAGAADLGKVLGPQVSTEYQLDMLIKELEKFSLLRRNAEAKTIFIHPLVQTVLREGMKDKEEVQRLWAERAILLVYRVYPEVELSNWPQCRRYLSQALACFELVKQFQLESIQAAQVLDRAGRYLRESAQYERAEELLQSALALREKKLGLSNPDTVASLNALAFLYNTQYRYAEAEPLFKRALSIREQTLGPIHSDVATSMDNLAFLYNAQYLYDDAELLFKRALEIRKTTLGPEHLDVATNMDNLALIYLVQQRYSEAEPLLDNALAIRKKILGPDHADVAATLNNLAGLYSTLGQFEKAEPLMLQALAIRKQALGDNHPDVATTINNLGGLYYNQERFAEAEPLMRQALAIRRKTLGEQHPDVAISQNNLAGLFVKLGKLQDAETFYRQALATYEAAAGPTNPGLLPILASYRALLHQLNRSQEAEEMEARIKSIQDVYVNE